MRVRHACAARVGRQTTRIIDFTFTDEWVSKCIQIHTHTNAYVYTRYNTYYTCVWHVLLRGRQWEHDVNTRVHAEPV